MTSKETLNKIEALNRIEEAEKNKATSLDLRGLSLTELSPEIGKLTSLNMLYLSENQLAALPPEIEKLTNLTYLDFFGNQLAALPPEIGKLTSLTVLSLSQNQLAALPQEIGKLTSLTELSLSGNQLTELPPEIGKLTNLTKLNLSDNKLSSLPPKIRKLNSLTELFLSKNKLAELPSEFGTLNSLTVLDISYNQLAALPTEIGNLTSLTEFNLSGNQLTALPPEIGKLTNLNKLSLSGNQLTTLPPEIWNLTSLTVLYFSKNQLTELPPEIGKLNSLTKLVLSGNQLTALPPEIGKLTNLNKLSLSGNQLTVLPPEIGNLSSLTDLDLSENQLAALPPEIVKLTNLKSLYLSRNKLSALPPEIGKLTSLIYLRLYGNQLSALPPEIGNLTSLADLDLSKNQLTDLPPEIGKLTSLIYLRLSGNQLATLLPEIGKLTSLTMHDLSGNQLAALPPEIGKLNSLADLDLSGNQLAALPPEIGKMSSLMYLKFSGNQLSALPPEIGKMKSLTLLDLSGNQLNELPPEIENLTSLIYLKISGNQLSALPPEIGKMKSLIDLNLSENKLTEIPPDIGNLTSLILLRLSGNQLTALPPKIGKLYSLTRLFLSNNQLTTLPPEIGKLTRLTELSIDEIKLKVPPPDIVAQGTRAILAYMRNILEKGEAARYEAKLLVLGDAGEGKTCLSRALRGLEFQRQTTTLGVEIDPWTFEHPDYPGDETKEITLHIWDFEGQEINHQSHQFFLTERSLYIVVFKGREQFRYETLEYWLDTIRSRAPGVEVLLVATECEYKRPQVPLDRLKAQFPDLLQNDPFYIWVGCADNKNIPDLRDHLKRLAAGLDLIGEPWPKNYADSEKAIKAVSIEKAHCTRKELYDLFKGSAVNAEDFNRLAAFLGDTGVITHFPGAPELEDFIVLRPQWLTKAISHVLEHEHLVKNYGECTMDWLRGEWEHEYPGLFLTFYYCMKEFELCYPLEDIPGTNLVPLRFSFARPLIPWSEIPGAKERRIQYRFNSTPPAGIMSRFIVKTHHLIARTGAMPKGVYWYNGVFLRTGKEGDPFTSEALCEFNKEERTFSITVQAAYPQNMVEQLHGFARAVFSFFKGLKPERYYGCVKEDGSQCYGLHDEETIAFSLTEPNIKIPCATGRHHVGPLFLVTGISSFPQSLSLDENFRKIIHEELQLKPEWAESFGFDINALLLQSETLNGKIDGILKNQKELPAHLEQQGQKIVRDLLNSINSLLDQRDFTPVPSTFIIIPVDRSRWNPKRFFELKYKLIPCCEHEKEMHEVEFQINFQCPREWWVKTAPILGTIVNLLTIAVKIGAAGVPLFVPTPQSKKFEDEINFMKEILEAIPKLGGDVVGGEIREFLNKLKASKENGEPVPMGKNVKSFFRAGGDINRLALMKMAALLEKQKPAEYKARKWGELERVKMPDETFRWLCKKHRDELNRKLGV